MKTTLLVIQRCRVNIYYIFIGYYVWPQLCLRKIVLSPSHGNYTLREYDIKLIWEKKSLSKCIIFNTKHLLAYTLLITKKSYWQCKSNLNHCSRIDFSDPTTDKPGNLANSAVLRLLEEEEHGRRRPGKSKIL